MLDPDQLTFALDMHSRSYRLLQWIAHAIDTREIPVPHVSDGHVGGLTASALDWIRPNLLKLPADIRPDDRAVEQFAAFFGTYITTSFDILATPNDILQSSGRCYCDLCARLVAGPHLKTRKVTTRDKRRAKTLILDRLCDLATEESLTLTRDDAQQLVADPDDRRAAAYSTYGIWLIDRTQGVTDGTSILALWREIAWDPRGSPRKDFRLQYRDFVDAENQLIALIGSMTRT